VITGTAGGIAEDWFADALQFWVLVNIIHVKNVFYVFVTFFYFPKVFLFLKNVGKVQSGKQINKKHFQNNSNEIQWVRK